MKEDTKCHVSSHPKLSGICSKKNPYKIQGLALCPALLSLQAIGTWSRGFWGRQNPKSLSAPASAPAGLVMSGREGRGSEEMRCQRPGMGS